MDCIRCHHPMEYDSGDEMWICYSYDCGYGCKEPQNTHLQDVRSQMEFHEIKAEYRKLGDVQKRDIDDGVQEAINGIESMRGVNDDAASPIHARLNGIFAFLVELQEAGWEAGEVEDESEEA